MNNPIRRLLQFAFVILLPVAWSAPTGPGIDLDRLGAHGFFELKAFSGKPDEQGVLTICPLAVPEYTAGCFFAADANPSQTTEMMPGGGNRVLPWVFGRDVKALDGSGKQERAGTGQAPDGIILMLKLVDGDTLVIVPIAGPKSVAWVRTVGDGRLTAPVASFGTAPVTGDLPVLAWARAANPYQAMHEAWDLALHCPQVEGRTDWRKNKQYPEPFRYLGWCSYEQYRSKISEKILVDVVDQIEVSGIPVRWLLVDGGHQAGVGKFLTSFTPDPAKFPHGWSPLISRRSPDKIRWMGLWNAFEAKTEGIARDNDMGDLNNHLMPAPDGINLVAKPDPESAQAFYDALIGAVKRHGFDFSKIDYQFRDLPIYAGRVGNAVAASVNKSQALEEACRRNDNGLINCMAQRQPCVFNWRYSAVTRCSIDYRLGNVLLGISHVRQSFHNTLWLGQTVWPDHDMFHSSDANRGRMMAVSKALSGAPVYLSDDPRKFVKEYIQPLCYTDGELLRPLAPAVPLPDSLYSDVFNRPAAYRVIAPLANGCAAVVIYNLMETETPQTISTTVTAEDYGFASAMMQPYPGVWAQPPEGLVIYDWYAGKGRQLDKPITSDLAGFSDRLLLLCPIKDGWAVVGRTDKYLSPAAVAKCATATDQITITLKESGPVVFWSSGGRPRAEDRSLTDLGNGFWKAELPVKPEAASITIKR